MVNQYKCDKCGKLLTEKEYKKSMGSVTGYHDFCQNCLKDWIKFSDKQEKERIKFMNPKDKTPPRRKTTSRRITR